MTLIDDKGMRIEVLASYTSLVGSEQVEELDWSLADDTGSGLDLDL